jgi:hypothetical protein
MDLYGGSIQSDSNDASLKQLKSTLQFNVNATRATLAVDPVAVVMKLLSQPNGIQNLCQHRAVRALCQSNPKMNVFFNALSQPGGLMTAYMMFADPTVKPALMELLPQIQDLLQ